MQHTRVDLDLLIDAIEELRPDNTDGEDAVNDAIEDTLDSVIEIITQWNSGLYFDGNEPDLWDDEYENDPW